MTYSWAPLKAPTIQEAQNSGSSGGVCGKVVRVSEGVVLKLGEEEGGVDMGVAVVDLWVVRWGSAWTERGHGMGPGVFAQSPQCRCVGAKVRSS